MTTPAVSDSEWDFIKFVVTLNRTTPRTEIKVRRLLGPIGVELHWQAKSNLWGRFGGGWDWELGFQAGESTIILNLLIFSVRLWRVEGWSAWEWFWGLVLPGPWCPEEVNNE
jgi:hypothetical protein